MKRTCFAFALIVQVSGILSSRACGSPPSSTAGQRDEAAVHVLSAALDVLGGQTLWSTITATRVTGTNTIQGSTTAAQFDWADDWSTSLYRVRKQLGADGSPISPQVQASTAAGSLGSPQVGPHIPNDFIEGIVVYAPAAAIFRVLQDQSYALHSLTIANQPTDSACIAVTVAPNQRLVGIWCFSSSSHLPLMFIQAATPIAPRPRESSKRITYNSFAPQGSVVMPSSVTVAYPFGQSLQVAIAHIELNPKLARNSPGVIK